MVEKLDKKRHHSEIDIVIKINELIDAYNKLKDDFENHSHQTGFKSKESSGPFIIKQ